MSNPMLRAANAILDLTVALDPSAPHDVNSRALLTAVEALQNAGAVTATLDGKPVPVAVNMTPLLTAVGATIGTLATLHGHHIGTDPLTVIAELREVLNEDLGG